jgi:hypothetical protein
VRLEEVPLVSALAQVKGAVYHFSFHTDRYSQSPLVIQVIRKRLDNSIRIFTGHYFVQFRALCLTL